jgi:hypothetical protein
MASSSVNTSLPLSSAVSLDASRKCDGTYVIAITMTVTNTGTSNVSNIAISDPIVSDPFFGKISGPDPGPVEPGPLVPGAVTHFYWTYTVSALPVTITGSVGSADMTVPWGGPDETVWTQARGAFNPIITSALSSTLYATAVLTSPGVYFFSVEMRIRNNGLTNIDNVTASSTQFGSPGASMLSGPNPALLATSFPGMIDSFFWTYTATAIPASFSAMAGGTDAVSLLPTCTNDTVIANTANSILTTGVTTKTVQMGPSQYYLVVNMTVTNTGVDPMVDFTVTPNLSFTGGVATSLWTGPVALSGPPGATGYYGLVNPNQGTTFQWTYSFTGNPSTIVSGVVTGAVSPSGPVVSKNFSALIATAQSPLSTSVSTRVHRLGKSQYYLVVDMTVTNTGSFPISNVLVGENLALGGVTSTKFSGPLALTPCIGPPATSTMFCGTLNAGQGTTFQWTYTLTGSLPVPIFGSVSGMVPAWNIYMYKTFTGTTSLPGSSCMASSLSITPEEELTSLASRWKLTVVLTVTNTGACPGSSIAVYPYKYLDVIPSGQAWYLSGPDPLSGGPILSGQGTSFTWTYSATGSATFTLGGYAMGEVDNPPGPWTNPISIEDYLDYTEAQDTVTTEDTGQPGYIKVGRNIFTSSSTKLEITFNIKEDDPEASLIIYNSISQKIRTLHSGLCPRRVDMFKEWDGKNDNGDRVASGVYYIRLETKRFVSTKKVILIK